jgi:cysteine desulfurase
MNINPAIYLDYNATTPVAPEVVNEMLPHFLSAYGNPSSSDHIMGWQAQEAIEGCRVKIARILNIKSEELIFTAGATEAINLAIRGLQSFNDKEANHIITLKSEHNAVLDTCIALENTGTRVSYLNVDKNGIINMDELADAFTEQTLMVSVMMVNNETGVIQPIKEIAALCKARGVIFMSDATQAIGKMPVNAEELGIDIMVGSAHKLYGPKGVGFLYIDKAHAKNLQPIITGGGQEQRKRAGTINVPGIIGMAKALDLAIELMDEDVPRIEALRDYFEEKLNRSIDISIMAENASRLYNTSNICLKNTDSEKVMQAIGSRVAASRGSACSSGKIEPSHVLSAMGMADEEALSGIRFSFGRYTTQREVDVAIELITKAVNRLKLVD